MKQRADLMNSSITLYLFGEITISITDPMQPTCISYCKRTEMIFPQSWLAKGGSEAGSNLKYLHYCNISPTAEVMRIPENNAVGKTKTLWETWVSGNRAN
jgi:hypothetical protein